TTGELILWQDEIGLIEGCVDALPGTTMTAYYTGTATEKGAPWAPDWKPFLEDQPVSGDPFAIEFTPPEEVVGQSVAIMVQFEDPEGRTYTAHLADLVTLLKGNDPEGCNESGSGFIGGPGCGDT